MQRNQIPIKTQMENYNKEENLTNTEDECKSVKLNGYRRYMSAEPVKWRNCDFDDKLSGRIKTTDMDYIGTINLNMNLNHLHNPNGQGCSNLNNSIVDVSSTYHQLDLGNDNGSLYMSSSGTSESKDSDSLKISRILRKLITETNTSTSLNLCAQLESAVRSPANAAYIRRSYDFVYKNLMLALKQCPLKSLETIANILGLVAYVHRNNFGHFITAMFKEYDKKHIPQNLIMIAFGSAVRCDAHQFHLGMHCDLLLQNLKNCLENTEDAVTFMSICDTITELSNNYSSIFDRHFKDIVDIIVGWHLETEQSPHLKHHCSEVLQKFSLYFMKHLDFSLGLLLQFLEDITGFGEDILSKETLKEKQCGIEKRIGAFIGAFNTIIKCLVGNTKVYEIHETLKTRILEGYHIIQRVTMQNFQLNLASEETILNVNDFLTLIYEKFQDLSLILNIHEFIECEMKIFDTYNDIEVRSFLFLIYNICKQMKTNLPIKFVTLILKRNDNPLTYVKLAESEKTRYLLLKIYQEILMIKNVPLLQEAYAHIYRDVALCIKNLVISNRNEMTQSEAYLIFYLGALTSLATQTSSIIIMYALNPSLLDLFVHHYKATDMILWSRFPTVHEALLNILITHCQRNNNFRTTSILLNEQEANSSPTSENFTIILQFLADILYQSKLISKIALKNLLDWLEKLLEDCRINYEVLAKNLRFQKICKALAALSLETPLGVAGCLKTLLKYKCLPNDVLECIRNSCLQMLDYKLTTVREIYAEIFSLLPLSVSLNNQTISYSRIVIKNQQLYNASEKFATLKPEYFKTFLDLLDPEKNTETLEISTLNSFCTQVFLKSWFSNLNDVLTNYMQMSQNSLHLVTSWMQFEAARYCVQNKLKTIIGKPQETFLAIEAIIMKYAKILSSKPISTTSISALSSSNDVKWKENENFLKNSLINQMQCRMLLGFLENLEKLIYNAAEGSAFGLAAAEKPAKTFFRVNAPTCNEWFKRIRNAVCLVSSHCMESEMTIRYCQNVLVLSKLPETSMDHYLLTMVSALLSCGESDTLYGLYSHLKNNSEKRYIWIQYVAEQAAFKKETAIEGYQMYLQEHKDIDEHLKNFIYEQLINCYSTTGQWSHLNNLLHGKQDLIITKYDYTNLGKLEKYFQEYAEFNQPPDNGDIFIKLSEWSLEDGKSHHQSLNENYNRNLKNYKSFSIFNILQHLEDNFINNNLSFDKDLEKDILAFGFQESLYHSWHDEFKEFVILNHIKNFETLSSVLKEDVGSINADSTTLLKYLYWSLKAHEKQNNLLPENFDLTSILFLKTAISAREEGNFKFAFYILEQFLKYKGIAKMWHDDMIINVADPQLVKGCIEASKLFNLQPTKNLNDTLAILAEVARQSIAYTLPTCPSTSPVASEVLLNMAENITQRPVGFIINLEQIDDLITSLPVDQIKSNSIVNTIMTNPDFIAGKLLNASILYDPNRAEAWYTFGNWCYRWGKKIVEPSSSIENQYGKFSQQDLEQIKKLFALNEEILLEKDLNQLLSVFNKHHLQYGESLEDDTNDTNSGEDLERNLRNLSFLSEKSSGFLLSLIKIWHQAQKNIYSYYEIATKAYFRYLCLKTSHSTEYNSSLSENHIEDSTFVTTTLRLLRLIVKHSVGLQEVIEDGLSSTPLRPWKIIIPQLFSRLNHHEPYVRKCVSELLCRLASLHSHLIIFPAVVGAQQHQEHQANSETSKRLAICFNDLLQTLTKQTPDTVSHVQLLVKELKRITLLWEENWLHSLAQLYSDYSPLINSLEGEIKKNKTQNLQKIEAKYQVISSHVIKDLEKLQTITNRSPETNYERTFQDRFNPYIKETIESFKKPFQLHKLSETWLGIKKLYGIFQHKSLRGSNYTLKVSELSPVLSRMSNTAIAMPGIDTNEQIYIKSVDSSINILPTKTKPKKLAFHGSDGKKYTYLFKGLEDLHLDERIMQFLAISNSMMAKSTHASNISQKPLFKAKHYSVIPLGPQSGLISWVDGVTPIFAIYKKWQQRESVIKQQQKERTSSKGNGSSSTSDPAQQQKAQNLQQFSVTPIATRPSELFYQKLTPLLTEQNMKSTDPRKQWPLATLKQVFKELSQETPKDLLANELWCQSINASEWRKSIRNYSISLAVMSVIGYIIGLGDRHLDNVLINLTSGEIVHIDYNVCFEKGRSLRIPEKVPFRMTQNLETALGITGVEGAFRLGCEHVLKILRKEKETLLTLLEAFVYDPLVDWTTGDETSTSASGITKSTIAHLAAEEINKINLSFSSKNNNSKDLLKINQLNYSQKKPDMEMAKQNIALRFEEIKPLWRQYINDLQEEFQYILDIVKNIQMNREKIVSTEKQRDNLTKQLAFIQDTEYLGTAIENHSLNTVSERYANYKKNLEYFNNILKSIRQRRDNIQNLLDNYFDDIVSDSSHTKFQFLQMNLNAEQQRQIPNEFDEVMSLMYDLPEFKDYEQCQHLRHEMNNMLERETVSLLETFDMLMQYSDVMMYYPRQKLMENPLTIYKKAYDKLLDGTFDEHFENQVYYEQFKRNSPKKDSITVSSYANALLEARQDLNYYLQKALNDLKEHKAQMLISYDMAISDVKTFMDASEPSLQEELQLRILNIIGKSNDSFGDYESNAFKDGIDPLDLLDQALDYINTVRNITGIVFPYLIDDRQQEAFTLFTSIQACLESLGKLKNAFILPLPEKIFKLYMLDDNEALQNTLKRLERIEFLESIDPNNIHKMITHNLLQSVLKDLMSLFQDVEENVIKFLEVLQHTTLNVLDVNNLKPIQIIEDTKFDIISELFRVMRKFTTAYKEQSLEVLYDPRSLVLLINDYVKCILENYFNGLISTSVRELKTAFGICLEPSLLIDINKDTKIQTVCHNMFLAEQQYGIFKQHQREVLRYTKWLDHLTFISTAHNWLHIKHLLGTLLQKLYNNTQILNVWKQTLLTKQNEIENLSIALDKFIQMEMILTDSNNSEIHEEFIQNSALQKQHCIAHVQLLDKLVEYSMTLLEFEKFSLYDDKQNEEHIFESLLNDYKTSKQRLENSLSEMTPMEKSLVELLDPEGPIDPIWLDNIKGLLNEMLHNAQKLLADFESEDQEETQYLVKKAKKLEDLLDHSARTDVRYLLKSIFKNEKNSRLNSDDQAAAGSNAVLVRDFQQNFKNFFANVSDTRLKMMSDDLSDEVLKDIITSVSSLKLIAQQKNDAFIDAIQSFIENAALAEAAAAAASNDANKMQNTGEEQKRNIYGVSVWKRVRIKLDGRDQDTVRRSTVPEQVDHIIREATSVDNLAILYEGWTPWV